MILARVTGTLFATRKNPRFEGKKILVVREEEPRGEPIGPTFLAVDRVDAGIGDRVIINKEGSSARLLFKDENLPLQAVIVAIVDSIELEGSAGDTLGS
jgi:ethanolamine utilization protein EutN